MVKGCRRRGVVLIDVLVAVVIMGSAMAIMIAMVGRALSSQDAGRKLDAAAVLLDEQLQLVLARGPDNYASRFPVRGACDPPFEDFSYELEFRGGEGGEPFLVVARVSWPRAGRMESASIEAMIAPRRGDEPDPDRVPADPVSPSDRL